MVEMHCGAKKSAVPLLWILLQAPNRQRSTKNMLPVNVQQWIKRFNAYDVKRPFASPRLPYVPEHEGT